MNHFKSVAFYPLEDRRTSKLSTKRSGKNQVWNVTKRGTYIANTVLQWLPIDTSDAPTPYATQTLAKQLQTDDVCLQPVKMYGKPLTDRKDAEAKSWVPTTLPISAGPTIQ